jgi:hypothetical protein
MILISFTAQTTSVDYNTYLQIIPVITVSLTEDRNVDMKSPP